mmetsp:Transcript_14090/g.19087  ORF Transcript_14090/g.19087 Transcript_14090/m.19087 type:complete len:264 (-) Transcript_14090:180-971(-)
MMSRSLLVLICLTIGMPTKASDLSSAMAADDECAAGDEQCALNAVQLRASKQAELAAMGSIPVEDEDNTDIPAEDENNALLEQGEELFEGEEKELEDDEEEQEEVEVAVSEEEHKAALLEADQAPVGECSTLRPCEKGSMCVMTADKTWTQCVPLNRQRFRLECVKWTDAVRLAAILYTKQQCQDSRCLSQAYCIAPYRCVESMDKTWAQCIRCSKEEFKTNCFAWTSSFQEAVARTCRHRCSARPCDKIKGSRNCMRYTRPS